VGNRNVLNGCTAVHFFHHDKSTAVTYGITHGHLMGHGFFVVFVYRMTFMIFVFILIQQCLYFGSGGYDGVNIACKVVTRTWCTHQSHFRVLLGLRLKLEAFGNFSVGILAFVVYEVIYINTVDAISSVGYG